MIKKYHHDSCRIQRNKTKILALWSLSTLSKSGFHPPTPSILLYQYITMYLLVFHFPTLKVHEMNHFKWYQKERISKKKTLASLVFITKGPVIANQHIVVGKAIQTHQGNRITRPGLTH